MARRHDTTVPSRCKQSGGRRRPTICARGSLGCARPEFECRSPKAIFSLGLAIPGGKGALQTELRFDHEPTLEEIKRTYLARLVVTHRGHRARIAEILGISERNTYRLLKKFGLDEVER